MCKQTSTSLLTFLLQAEREDIRDQAMSVAVWVVEKDQLSCEDYELCQSLVVHLTTL